MIPSYSALSQSITLATDTVELTSNLPKLIGGFKETKAIYDAKLAGVWKSFQQYGRRPAKSIWHASMLAETFSAHFGAVLHEDLDGSFARVRAELNKGGV